MRDTFGRLSYASIKLQIPENAIVLSWEKEYPQKYLLYAKTEDFKDFDVFDDLVFRINGGIPLKEYEPKLDWIFEV